MLGAGRVAIPTGAQVQLGGGLSQTGRVPFRAHTPPALCQLPAVPMHLPDACISLPRSQSHVHATGHRGQSRSMNEVNGFGIEEKNIQKCVPRSLQRLEHAGK